MVRDSSTLPKNWSRRTVGDTGTYINGFAFKPSDWGQEGRPIIRIQNLTGSAKQFNRTTREVASCFLVRDKDILVSWSASLDAFLWRGEEALLNQHIFKVLPNRQMVLPQFLFFLLKHAIRSMVDGAHLNGTTMKHINRDPFLSFPIALPPQTEQEKIAAVLWRVQRAIEVEEELLTTTRELKQSSMRQLFTRGLRSEQQVESAIGPIPKSWRVLPATHIFKLTSGSTRPADLALGPTPERPFPVLGGNGVMGYSSEWNLDLSQCLVIGRVGEYCGATHLAHGKMWITDNALYAKEWLDDTVRVDYLAAFLAYYDLNRFKRTAGQPLVTQGLINEHSFPIPTPEEQEEIAMVLHGLDRKIDLHERKRATLKELLEALLDRLLTGDIPVTDLEIDVSEAAVH